MEDYNENVCYDIIGNIDDDKHSEMIAELEKSAGINKIEISNKHEVIINYNMFLISKNLLEKIIRAKGLVPKEKDRHKGKFKQLINKIINDNKAVFDENNPGCCHSKN